MLDLAREYERVRAAVETRVRAVFDAQRFILGQTVEEFEEAFCEFTGCAHANDPCTLTADSVGGSSTADWGVTWTVKQGAATLFTSTANPYNPVLAGSGMVQPRRAADAASYVLAKDGTPSLSFGYNQVRTGAYSETLTFELYNTSSRSETTACRQSPSRSRTTSWASGSNRPM